MKIRLLVASSNKGKLRDFAIAARGDVDFVPLPGLEAIAAPDEDQDTFEGNARMKAAYYSLFAPGKIVIADDSGLEVDALGGAPGVRSARYADDSGFQGAGSVDERNNLCLLEALGDAPVKTARYRCVLVAARDGRVLTMSEAALEGEILAVARGSSGFGYDPYFLPKGSEKSMAELGDAERMLVSHRGRALGRLLRRLKDLHEELT